MYKRQKQLRMTSQQADENKTTILELQNSLVRKRKALEKSILQQGEMDKKLDRILALLENLVAKSSENWNKKDGEFPRPFILLSGYSRGLL